MLRLKTRSKHLALFLIDDLLTRKVYPQINYELLCVSAVIFIVKFEGDFTIHLPDFNDFVRVSLKISLPALRYAETVILDNLPASFGRLVTFSEMNNFLLETMKKRVQIHQDHQAKLDDLITQAYIELPFGYDWFSLAIVCFFAYDKNFDLQKELVDFLVVTIEKTYQILIHPVKDKMYDLLVAVEAISIAWVI